MGTTKKVIRLSVSSWVGTLAHARHYYGTLQDDGNKDITVERKLSIKEQRALNKEDGVPEDHVWDDRTSSRFNSKAALYKVARAMAKEKFGKNVVVFITLPYTSWELNPSEMLLGPEPLRTKANRAWRDFEKRGGFGTNSWTRAQNREADLRAKAWRRIINPILKMAGRETEP